MASPVTVTTAPTLLAKINTKRNTVTLQNVGDQPVYVVKHAPNTAIPVPSPTNYDFILSPGEKKEDNPNYTPGIIERFEVVSAFYGVVSKDSCKVAVMEAINKAVV